MNWQAISFDWNQVRAFLATAEEGSLSAAARALGLTQPTLSRQVTALEETLGVVLFERGPRAMTLTTAGREVLSHVRAMGDAATRLSLAASGQSQDVAGEVSLTSTTVFATLYLPEVLEKLRTVAPKLTVNVITSNDLKDLTRREADISIRHARPDQPDLIGKLVNETTGRLYASKAYLDLYGRPQTIEDLSQHTYIGFDTVERILPMFHSMGLPIDESNIRITTTSGTLIIALIRAGLGVSFLTKDMAELYPDVEEVFPDLPPVPVPVWLVTHRELRTSRRIRIVYDLLTETFSGLG